MPLPTESSQRPYCLLKTILSIAIPQNSALFKYNPYIQIYTHPHIPYVSRKLEKVEKDDLTNISCFIFRWEQYGVSPYWVFNDVIFFFGLRVVAHAYILRPWKIEKGGLGVQDQPQLYIKFETRLCCMSQKCIIIVVWHIFKFYLFFPNFRHFWGLHDWPIYSNGKWPWKWGMKKW